VPICPFVRAYIGRHPEYNDLVTGDLRCPTDVCAAERGPTRTYSGEAIEVHWEPRLCIHVQNCVRTCPRSSKPASVPGS
jgi:ferredoxin